MDKSIKKKSLHNMKIGVLMGGFGAEREVSFLSGQTILDSLKSNQYNAIKIDPKENFLETLKTEQPDVLLNLLHGPFGEDGIIQAILEYLRIPFVGENPLSSGIAMNKLRTKEVLTSYGIRTASHFPFYQYQSHSFPLAPELFDDILRASVNTPFFLKDTVGGSSKGIWRIKNLEDLTQVLSTSDIHLHPSRFFVENGVIGREISVGVYRNETGITVLPIAEVETEEEFFNFDAKYSNKNTHDTIPADLPEEITSRVRLLVTEIYNIMKFRGCVRIDFILDEAAELEPVLLEINNQPGMTEHSFIPLMLVEAGIPLIDFLVEQISLVEYYPKPNF